MASEVAEESISVVPDHLYEIPSSALEHVVLRESECCESALRMEENESSALEEHVVLKEKECHGSALRMEENECYGSSALEHVVLKENECYGSALKMEENECYGSSALEEHVVLNENECYGSAFKMKENDCYESLQLKNMGADSQAYQQPQMRVVKLQSSSSFSGTLIFAVVLAFTIGIIFIPVYFCLVPGLTLAALGCILNRSMYNKHTIKALNGVSLCCSFCALISFVSTVSTTIIFFFVFYAPWYVLWAGHY